MSTYLFNYCSYFFNSSNTNVFIGSLILTFSDNHSRYSGSVFATSTNDDGLIIFIEDNKVTTSPVATVAQFKELHQGAGEYNNIEQWQDSYAAQLNVETRPKLAMNAVTWNAEGEKFEGTPVSIVSVDHVDAADDTSPYVAVDGEGKVYYLINGISISRNAFKSLIRKEQSADNPAWNDKVTYDPQKHKLTNGDATFMFIGNDEDFESSDWDITNFNALKKVGFKDSIFS